MNRVGAAFPTSTAGISSGRTPSCAPPVSDFKEFHGFGIRIEEAGGTARVSFSGELDLSNVHLVEESIARAQRDNESVVVDLAMLTFLDSSGVEAFLAGARRAETKGEKFVIVNSHSLGRVFEMTRSGFLLDRQGAA